MEYFKLGSNDVSRLGFGCMRLPERDNKIDYDEALKMAEYAINNGINYFDTAYIYHDGDSEKFIKKAIEKFGRDKFYIADKLPSFNISRESDLQDLLDEQLERLGTDYIDYYLLHCLNSRYFDLYKRFNYKEFIKRNIDNGKIKHIGFSFHDNVGSFKEILDDYDWDFCQIQLNYLDIEYQAGIEGYEYATNKGVPVIVMSPLRGGMLANIPETTRHIFDKTDLSKYADALIAYKYVANLENVRVVLSGMNSMNDMVANVDLFKVPLVNTLSDEEKRAYINARNEFYNYKIINCTTCDYCKDACPHNIPISEIFTRYNDDIEFPNFSNNGWYNKLEKNASNCIKCGNCEDSCPQNIDIVNKLETVHEHFKA